MYAKYVKCLLDFALSLLALIILSPILLIAYTYDSWSYIYERKSFFTQPRLGKDEKIFNLLNSGLWINRRDKEENLLSDDLRLNKYGRFLRSTSLDEFLELVNIILGDMSIIGEGCIIVTTRKIIDSSRGVTV